MIIIMLKYRSNIIITNNGFYNTITCNIAIFSSRMAIIKTLMINRKECLSVFSDSVLDHVLLPNVTTSRVTDLT